MRGLTISTRCPAISARRRRRINSSLLPLNIGPQTTSSQPPWWGCVLITGGTLRGAPDVHVRLALLEAETLVEPVRGLAFPAGRQLDRDRACALCERQRG